MKMEATHARGICQRCVARQFFGRSDQGCVSLSHAPSIGMRALARTKACFLRVPWPFQKTFCARGAAAGENRRYDNTLSSSRRQKQNGRQPDDLSTELRATVSRRRRLQMTMIE